MGGFVGGDPFASPTFGKSLSLRVDGGFSAVSINPSGRDVVLAGRQGLYIIDLDDPFSAPRWLHHVTPWQVADVQWSPHPAKSNRVVSTSNQKAIIWNLAKSSDTSIEHVLHGHFRAITDINFNRQHPDILSTCSIDTYVHCWDLRSPSRPFYTTSAWSSGASQVKWNYIDPNVFASSHGNDIFIWDIRNGSTPLSKLSGHESSVNSIDFNKYKRNEIMTCSNDGSVKFWDFEVSSEECLSSIKTDFPIWRGRYLPFGNGCCIMPMNGGENSVYMVSSDDYKDGSKANSTLKPVETFKGHSDTVLDFIWRSRHSYDAIEDDREYQMVTWSKDCDLRLWPITDDIYDKIKFERGKKLEEKLKNYEYKTYNKEPEREHDFSENKGKRYKETFVTSSGVNASDDVNHMNWISGVRMNTANNDSPEAFFKERRFQNLGEEVSSIGHKFPKIVFEKISVSTGELVITLKGPWLESNADEYIFLRLKFYMPPEYPSATHPPTFTIEENSQLTEAKRTEITTNLKDISKKYTDLDLYCLEPCLRFALGEKVDLDDIERNELQMIDFDLSDNIDYDEVSSLVSSEMPLSDSSSDSEAEKFEEPLTASEKLNNIKMLGRNLMFDSTPVPNECGMAWTPSGKLICFFSGEQRIDAHFPNLLHRASISNSKAFGVPTLHQKDLYDNEAGLNKPPKIVRPKRYVDTITNNADGKMLNNSSDDERSVETDLDSSHSDWDDIIDNDIFVRGYEQNLSSNFAKIFDTGLATTNKTADSTKTNKNLIRIHDFQHLIPEKRELAVEYQYLRDKPEEMARANAIVAEKYGYENISHCWQTLSNFLMIQKQDNPYDIVWNLHPMGLKWYVKEVVKYFERQNNLQMLAMVGCTLVATQFSLMKATETQDFEGENDGNMETLISFPPSPSQDAWKNDVHSSFSASAIMPTIDEAPSRSTRANSPDTVSTQLEDYFNFRSNHSALRRSGVWSADLASMHVSNSKTPTVLRQSHIPNVTVALEDDDVLNVINTPSVCFLDNEDAFKLESYVYQYANLLFRWGLSIERAKILKLQFNQDLKHEFLLASTLSQFSGINMQWIANTEPTAIHNRSCVFCCLKVTRGIFNCGHCQHVMHSACARKWWDSEIECPSGCGCNCLAIYDLE